MFKMRTAILGSAAALAIALPAGAQNYGYSDYDSYSYGQSGYNQSANSNAAYLNCERERRQRQQTAGVVGAIAGSLLGATIADDDDDNRYRNRHRGYNRYDRRDRYGRYDRYDRRGYGRHHRDNDGGDQIAGAVIGAIVGGVAGSALGGSGSDDCARRVQAQPTYQYGNRANPPSRVTYDNRYDPNAPNRGSYSNDTYNRTYSQDELYGGERTYRTSTTYSNGATTTGYNTGYQTQGYDSGECRIVYQGNRERTACNVGGDRWEFVD